MRRRAAWGLAAALLLGGWAGAEEPKSSAEGLKSGLPVGKSVPAFQVVKCGGAPDDGVKDGEQLCYR